MRDNLLEQRAGEALLAVDRANLLALARGPALDLIPFAFDLALVELDLRAGRNERRQAHRDRTAERLGDSRHDNYSRGVERARHSRGHGERCDHPVVEAEHQVADTRAAGGVNLLGMMIVLALANCDRHLTSSGGPGSRGAAARILPGAPGFPFAILASLSLQQPRYDLPGLAALRPGSQIVIQETQPRAAAEKAANTAVELHEVAFAPMPTDSPQPPEAV